MREFFIKRSSAETRSLNSDAMVDSSADHVPLGEKIAIASNIKRRPLCGRL
jgi:hypothetical protein